MRLSSLFLSTLVVGCAANADDVQRDPTETATGGTKADGAAGVPDVRCDALPATGPVGGFTHKVNTLLTHAGDPRHRGIDLVTGAGAATQTLEGWITYTVADKGLMDEAVDLFACRAGAWK